MLEERNTPIDNYKSPANFAYGRQLQSILPVSSNNLTVKPADNDKFMQKIWDMKSKQKKYYYQHTKEQMMLHTGETVPIFRDEKWKETASTAADDDYIRVETCTDPCGPKWSKRQQVLQLMMTILEMETSNCC